MAARQKPVPSKNRSVEPGGTVFEADGGWKLAEARAVLWTGQVVAWSDSLCVPIEQIETQPT